MSTLTVPGTHRPRAARTVAALAGAFLLIVVLATTVLASSPRRLSAQVTDDVGAISGGAGSVQPALDDLQRAANVQLWVWFTDTTGGLSAPDFATQTAQVNGFGGNDLLLVLAMTDHAYGYWKSDAIPLSNAQLDTILGADLEAGLRSGQNGSAIVATAAGIRDAINGASGGPAGASASGAPTNAASPPASGGDPLGTLLAVLLFVAVIAALGWWILFGRQRQAAAGAAPGAGAAAGGPVDDIAAMKTPDLETLANQALVQTDDAVRDSEQELGFAQAQFGDDEVAPFQAVIADAKGDLAAAFKLRQQLDDAIPEDAATHRRMLEELVRGCRRAQARLDDVKEEFERLREIEAKAPQILAALPAQADALEARLPAAQAGMTRLSAYADASWHAVAPNIDEAQKRLAAVREAVDEGAKAIAANDLQTAGRAARLGQDALGQGTAFLDAIDRLATELDEAKAKVDQMLADADRDLAQATQASSGSADPALAGRLAQAATLLSGARTALAGPKPDVAAAFAQARDAHTIADDALAARANRERAARPGRRPAGGLDHGGPDHPHARLGLHRDPPRGGGDRGPHAARRGAATPGPGRRRGRCRPGGRCPGGRPGHPARECRLPGRRRRLRALRRSVARRARRPRRGGRGRRQYRRGDPRRDHRGHAQRRRPRRVRGVRRWRLRRWLGRRVVRGRRLRRGRRVVRGRSLVTTARR